MLPEDNVRLKETSEYENYDVLQLKRSKDFHNQYMQNALQLNNGNNTFSEIAFHSGVAMTDWSWGALILDMDNDGYKDIFVSNGIYHDLTNQDFMDFFANDILQKMVLSGRKESVNEVVSKMPSTPIKNYAFKSNQDLTFSNQGEAWGIDDESFSNGAAYGDLDNDGDLDLIINNVNQQAFVYRNESNTKIKKNNYIQLKLKGDNANTYAIGSRVNAYVGNEILTQEIYPSRGFQSSVDYILTLGIGKKTKIDSIKITWPDNSFQTEIDPSINSLLEVKKKQNNTIYSPQNDSNKNMFFSESVTQFDKHQENNYVDFDYEGLIYQMLSKEGPITAIADVNNDGKDDIFIGGAKHQLAQLYISNSNNYLKKESFVFNEDILLEDTAATFLEMKLP